MLFLFLNDCSTKYFLVYRVNYLTAKARRDRWQEEKLILEKEQIWTCTFFQHQQTAWEKRGEIAKQVRQWNWEGLYAYSQKQAKMWLGLRLGAEEAFSKFRKEERPTSVPQSGST